MPTLKDLKDMREEGLIRVKIDFPYPDDEDGTFVSVTTHWDEEIALCDDIPKGAFGKISVGEGLITLSDGRTFKIRDVCLFVSVERGRKARRPYVWGKIKKQLKECNFTHREGRSDWFNVWEQGGWNLEPK
jgi:hypothetical protein